MDTRREQVMTLLDALWSRGDEAPLRALVSDDFRYALSAGTRTMDLSAYLETVHGFRAAFSPIELLFHRVLCEGGRVAAHYSLLGEHSGPFYGTEPTGRVGSLEVMSVLHFEADRLVRQTSVTDFLTLRRRLAARDT
ncbi:MAG: ester cyclase [Pseudomonadales bacterium]|jgi:predicted ester cyclase|nr:ester cyclase [Pseudomonadales bacterium]